MTVEQFLQVLSLRLSLSDSHSDFQSKRGVFQTRHPIFTAVTLAAVWCMAMLWLCVVKLSSSLYLRLNAVRSKACHRGPRDAERGPTCPVCVLTCAAGVQRWTGARDGDELPTSSSVMASLHAVQVCLQRRQEMLRSSVCKCQPGTSD